jgi:hypothetical protein
MDEASRGGAVQFRRPPYFGGREGRFKIGDLFFQFGQRQVFDLVKTDSKFRT